MSGHGEQSEQEEPGAHSVTFGDTLYDADGNVVGTVRGIEEGGVFVTMRDGIKALSLEHARAGHEFGEAELMWRCTECGEMGDIEDGLPEQCPNCGTEKENLMYWTED